jgi:hypothetical protein
MAYSTAGHAAGWKEQIQARTGGLPEPLRQNKPCHGDTRSGGEPGLQQVIDKGTQVITQDQENRQENNGKQDDDQGKFDKTLPAAVRGQS